MTDIRFDLLENAKDSLTYVVQVLVSDDVGPEASVLKQAIVSTYHCIELLLKEKLRREHPAFIWQNIDKYPGIDAHTVSTDTAVKRIESLTQYRFSDDDKDTIKSIKTTRNAIEHFEWHTNRKEARRIVGQSMAFAFSFAETALGEDLTANSKADDTWQMLVSELYEFVQEYGKRLAVRARADGSWTEWCDECEQETVPSGGGSCKLCGHWQRVEDEYT